MDNTDKVIERLFEIQNFIHEDGLKYQNRCKDLTGYSDKELTLMEEHLDFAKDLQRKLLNLYVAMGALDGVKHMKIEDLEDL